MTHNRKEGEPRTAACRLLLALAMLFLGLPLQARESQYELLKKQLTAESLPLVNLTVDIGTVRKNAYVEGEIEIADFWRRTDASSDTARFRCKLKYRGGSSLVYEKKSFAVKLIDEDGDDLDAKLLGIRAENSWILDAMAIDRTRMRNRVCFDVWNALSRTPYHTNYQDRNGTEGVFVEVFVNGDYHGLYCMTDKINRKLLGLKKAKLAGKGNVAVRGVLYKGNSWGSADDLLSYAEADTDKDTWNVWELKYPDDYPSADTWQPLMDLIDFCSDATPDADYRQGYRDYFYPDNLTDYMVFTLALNVGDNAYKNTFLSTVDVTAGHCYLVTPWDMDMSLGGHWDGKYNESLANPDRYNYIAPFNRLYVQNIDGFKDGVASKWQELNTTLFSPEHVAQLLDAYADEFARSGAWAREYEKWNGNPVPLHETVQEELDYVKDWYGRNYDHLCKQLSVSVGVTRPAVAESDGAYYTLDGRKVSRDARLLTKGIYIKDGRKVVVR